MESDPITEELKESPAAQLLRPLSSTGAGVADWMSRSPGAQTRWVLREWRPADMRHLITILVALGLSALAAAATPQAGATLESFTIDDPGELTLEGDEVSHRPWSLQAVLGRPAYLQHMAARVGLDETYKPLSDALESRAYAPGDYVAVAIVNRDDAAFGSGLFVDAALKANKRRHPDANIVVDAQGKVLERWGLQPKNAAVLILDSDGTVLFFKEGELTPGEQARALELLEEAIRRNKEVEHSAG